MRVRRSRTALWLNERINTILKLPPGTIKLLGESGELTAEEGRPMTQQGMNEIFIIDIHSDDEEAQPQSPNTKQPDLQEMQPVSDRNVQQTPDRQERSTETTEQDRSLTDQEGGR